MWLIYILFRYLWLVFVESDRSTALGQCGYVAENHCAAGIVHYRHCNIGALPVFYHQRISLRRYDFLPDHGLCNPVAASKELLTGSHRCGKYPQRCLNCPK